MPEYYFSSLPMTPCVTRVSSLFFVEEGFTQQVIDLAFQGVQCCGYSNQFSLVNCTFSLNALNGPTPPKKEARKEGKKHRRTDPFFIQKDGKVSTLLIFTPRRFMRVTSSKYESGLSSTDVTVTN